jgi:phage/plasmid-associated DNA primase
MYETLNIYARFVADCCEPCPCDDRSGCVSTADSWKAFTQYCDNAREESGTERMFGNTMVEMGYPSKDQKHRRKINGKDRQVNVRRGLRLKSDSIEPVTPGHSDAVDLEQFDN